MVCSVCTLSLSACAAGPVSRIDTGLSVAVEREDASAAMTGPHNFDWLLAGDKTIAPQQVFSTPLGIWLHFAAGQTLPAIFGASANAPQVLLKHRLVAPYVFVQGPWQGLVFRAAHREARATQSAAPRNPLARQDSSAPKVPSTPQDPSAPLPLAASSPPLARLEPPPQPLPAFNVMASDRTIRQTLKRWSDAVGWTFATEHWAVAVDIPLTAQADMGGDYHAAVSALLASTEMSDTPVQPCFYANRVLRVVGLAQQCDPRVNPQDAAGRFARAS